MNKNQDGRADYLVSNDFGALGKHARCYIELLHKQNYNRSSISQHRKCLINLGRSMSEKRLVMADLDEVAAAELVTSINKLKDLRTSAVFITNRFVRYLAEQGLSKPLPPPTPKDVARAELRRDYEAYLRRQRGLARAPSSTAGALLIVFWSSASAPRSAIYPPSRRTTLFASSST